MKKFYFLFQIILLGLLLVATVAKAQPGPGCLLLTATHSTYESRCAATGSIKIKASGGSGNYKYKVTGPVNTNFTTTDSITGLSSGIYTLFVIDVLTNCTFTASNVIVGGNYQDPRFTLSAVDVSCDNGSNGSITVNSQQFGLAPFAFSIVAPSPSSVGTMNGTGVFTGLSAGTYSIRMTDSCGGIQTRQVSVGNYTWWIDIYPFTKQGCDIATGFIRVIDSRGNISTVGAGIPALTYGIVRSPGDTLWSSDPNFTFSLLGNNTFDIIVKDACGTIKKGAVNVSLAPMVGTIVNIYNYTCNTFDAAVTGVKNFIGANFCLYDNSNVLVSCNSTGTFTGVPYGSYCIQAHDSCTDSIITRCFNAVPPPISVSDNVIISDKTCTDFTAAVTGQTNLTNPYYCLYDSLDVLISCGNTGIFTLLPYGHYCIKTKDGCRDTTITTCFTVTRPTPIVNPVVPAYSNCNNFGVFVTGDSLTGPQFCLFDSLGTLIDCNSTGIFDSLGYGGYCVSVHDACTDTTIIKCFSAGPPVINNDLTYTILNKTCKDFTVNISSSNKLTYCLFDSSGTQIICNLTGVFDNLLYGNYCVEAINDCPDTSFKICFNATPPIPQVSAAINTSQFTCTTFRASVTGQKNLTKPTYCIYDSSNTLIICNTSGVFTNLPFGTYCIKITNLCYDTVITRCFTKTAPVFSITGNTNRSCSLGYAKFTLDATSGVAPVNIKIYRKDGSLFLDSTYNSNNITVDSIPAVSLGTYKIVATDNCGNQDSVSLGAVASYFDHVPYVVTKCPGGNWATGSGNIVTDVATNLGALTVRIIKKDGATYFPALTPNTVTGSTFTFIDLGPGIYIMTANENSCNKTLYDTITINDYQFPNLTRSSAYQCDVNGFTVSAIASNGVGPFTYEIIGSVPTAPSIIAGPQASPVFNIDNGFGYSLIRLRALDACGNATLGDASILPLVLNGIVASKDCLFSPTTLTTDSVFNATYEWYKYNDDVTDSVFLGIGTKYFIPDLLPTDTGVYVCHLSVNTGCVNRTYLFHLTGDCKYNLLPVTLFSFTGHTVDDKNILNWKTAQEQKLNSFIVERKNNSGGFTAIGNVHATGNSNALQQYKFMDDTPPPGKNYYRLKMVDDKNGFNNSNVIVLNNGRNSNISIYPNPAKEKITVSIDVLKKHQYKISLLNALGQTMKEIDYNTDGPGKVDITRSPGMNKGIYILRIVDTETNEVFTEKVIFL